MDVLDMVRDFTGSNEIQILFFVHVCKIWHTYKCLFEVISQINFVLEDMQYI
jgi:hypothetical protein